MKIRTVMKIAVISSIVLLCTGFAMYSYFKLTAVGNRNNFNLYALVPPTTVALLETDDVADLVQDVSDLSCSQEQHYLYLSKLFSLLKLHFYTMLEDTPHGLSQQMNKMLLSFHEPDNEWNQVLYCTLGSGDYQLIEKFVNKHCSSNFPSKIFDYRGEEIRIYPMTDGNFLALYVTSRFLVVSFQKRLIEQVIDTYLTGKSLLREEAFEAVCNSPKINTRATIYARMHLLDAGNITDDIPLGGWTEFDMRMKEDVIYFSGTSHDTDTCSTFMNMLRKQQAVEGFPGNLLPSTTFLFSKRSVSNWQAMYLFTAEQEYAKVAYSDVVKDRDEELLRYIQEHGGAEITTCLFRRSEEVDTVAPPAVVMTLPVASVAEAERLLKSVIDAFPVEEGCSVVSPVVPRDTGFKLNGLYVLPRNTLLAQLAGITESALHTYACFYAGHLLLAPDAESLSLYVQYLANGEVLGGVSVFEKGVSSLSSTYNFMLVADLNRVFAQPKEYVRLVPAFFFRNQEFFRHFTLSAQFTCSEGVVSPNVVLIYQK